MVYNSAVFPRTILVTALFLGAVVSLAQQPAATPQPPVKVNVLNVCTPSADDQKELSSALAKVPAKPVFGNDYEVARGRSTLDQSTAIPGMVPLPAGASSTANWVRVRREFPASAPFTNAQYSFSTDPKTMVETLVLRVREPKDLMQISIEDSASTVTSAAAMLATDTPVARIKLERFGKASVVLARCNSSEGGPLPDQTVYEPIFRSASSLMSHYRDVLGVRRMVPQELARLGAGMAAKKSTGAKKNP
jgi:hypothetical protein